MGRIPQDNQIIVLMSDRELECLFDYAHVKEMTPGGVLRMAFRLFDLVEKTPGMREHIAKISSERLGPKMHPDYGS